MPKISLLEDMLKEEREEDRWDWKKDRDWEESTNLWKEKVISNHMGACESWDTSWNYPLLEMLHISIYLPKTKPNYFCF